MTLLGWLRDPFQLLSDLQLGDEKVTLNHLVHISFSVPICFVPKTEGSKVQLCDGNDPKRFVKGPPCLIGLFFGREVQKGSQLLK